jgi:hypothetical protein
VIPGQHTWDRDREILDLELEVLPGRTVTPLVGYRWNRYEGPRQTTYHVGQDEFRLSSDLEETEEEFYVGLSFHTDGWFGTFIQGWREFKGEDRLGLAPGEGDGNNSRPVLGTDVSLSSFERTVSTKADTPVTTLHVNGALGRSVRLIASYVRADGDSDTAATEMLSGSLVSFRLARFFEGLDQSIVSRTDNENWRGEARLEIALGQNVGLDLGYEKRRRELDGVAMVSSLYLDTLNFGGADPQDIAELIEAESGYDRDEEIVNARLDLRDIGPLVVWVEGAVNSQDLTLSPDISEIVASSGQGGSFDREISFLGAGASVLFGKSRVSFDIMTEDADDIVVRTDFDKRVKLRGRLDLPVARWLRVLGTAELINADNISSGVGYDAETTRYAVDLDFTPTDDLTFRLAWDDYSTDSSVSVRRPQDFGIERSEHAEDGELLEASLLWRISRVGIDVGYSKFENDGSFPFELERTFARLGVDLTKSIEASVEYETHDYSEEIFASAHFDAGRIGVFLRWRN